MSLNMVWQKCVLLISIVCLLATKPTRARRPLIYWWRWRSECAASDIPLHSWLACVAFSLDLFDIQLTFTTSWSLNFFVCIALLPYDVRWKICRVFVKPVGSQWYSSALKKHSGWGSEREADQPDIEKQPLSLTLSRLDLIDLFRRRLSAEVNYNLQHYVSQSLLP